jgi:hypothetical protein
MTDPADWAVYQRAMLDVARFDVATLAARVPVRRGATRLLDIAGSHGLFGAALCRKHPPMTSTVTELPQALEAARALAAAERITDVVTHRAGDITTLDFAREPEGLSDAALLANILHHFDPAQNRDIPEARPRRAESGRHGGHLGAGDARSAPARRRGRRSRALLPADLHCGQPRGADYAAWLTRRASPGAARAPAAVAGERAGAGAEGVSAGRGGFRRQPR